MGSCRALLADKGLSQKMVKIALWFIEQALFVASALLNLLTSSGDPSQDAPSLWAGQTHIPHVHRKGSWGRNSQEGERGSGVPARGSWRSSTSTSALIHCVLTGRNQKVQRRHPRVIPPGPGNCIIKVLRGDSPGLGGLPAASARPQG